MRRSKAIGPQTHHDFLKMNLPPSEFPEDRPPVILQDKSYYSCKTSNVWQREEKLCPKNQSFLHHDREQDLQEMHMRSEQFQMQESLENVQQIRKLHEQEDMLLNKRQFQTAILQIMSNQNTNPAQEQVLDQNQLVRESINPKLIILQTPKRQFMPNSAPNEWNRMEGRGAKNTINAWPEKVIRIQEKAIEKIKQRIEDDQKLDQMRDSALRKKREETRRQFIQRHNNNLEFQKELKLGVMGQYQRDPNDGTISRTYIEPQCVKNSEFETKFAAQRKSTASNNLTKSREIVYQAQSSNNMSIQNLEFQKQSSARLSGYKRDFKPQEVENLSEFKGMILAQCDEDIVLRLKNIVDPLQSNQRISELMQKVEQTTLAQDRSVRPLSSMTTSKISMNKKRSVVQRSTDQTKRKFQTIGNHSEATNSSIIQDNVMGDIEEFQIGLEQIRNQKIFIPYQNQYRVAYSQIQNQQHNMLNSFKGYLQLKESKQNPGYPFYFQNQKIVNFENVE